jgi:hypothetical protein
VISYRLGDDTISIHEPPQRNTGIIGGRFLERTRVSKPGKYLSEDHHNRLSLFRLKRFFT